MGKAKCDWQWHGVIAKGNSNSDAVHNYGIEITDSNRFVAFLVTGLRFDYSFDVL